MTALQNQTQMLLNQAKHLVSLPTSLVSAIDQTFTQTQNVLRNVDRIAYDVQAIGQAFTSYQHFNASQSDQQLIALAQGRWQTSIDAFQHSLSVGAATVNNLSATQTQTGTLVSASQSAVGAIAGDAGRQPAPWRAVAAVVGPDRAARRAKPCGSAGAGTQGRCRGPGARADQPLPQQRPNLPAADRADVPLRAASMRQCGVISTLLLFGALSGCTIPLSSWSSRPTISPDDGTALDARLARCAALGASASADADCQDAWAAARRRILPLPPEK